MDGGFEINPSFYFLPYNYTGDDMDGVIYNVSYGIRAPVKETMLYFDAPEYSYRGSLVKNPASEFSGANYEDNDYSSVFSLLNKSIGTDKRSFIPSLCNRAGSNYWNFSKAKLSLNLTLPHKE